MVDVVVLSRKHYSGVDADKAGITGVLGDTYAANDSGKFYYWNDSLNAWKTGLGYEAVIRDVAAKDFDATDFTKDGAWHLDGLDLSGIVPVGAVEVKLRLNYRATAASVNSVFRANATTRTNNQFSVYSQVANVRYEVVSDVAIDSDRLLDYNFPATVNVIDLYVVGWKI